MFVDVEEGEVDCDHIHHGASHILVYDNKPGSNGTSNFLWKKVVESIRKGGEGIFQEAMRLLNTCQFCQEVGKEEGGKVGKVKDFDLGCPGCVKLGTSLPPFPH